MRGLSLILAVLRATGDPPRSPREAWATLRRGQPARARAAALRLLARPGPARPGLLRLLGDTHLALGAPGLALGPYGRLLPAAGPGPDPSLHLNAGHALRAVGRLPEAERQYRLALAPAPDLPEALAALGSALLAGGRAPEALGALGRALALRPQDRAAGAARIAALEAVNRVGEAVRLADRLLERDPDEPTVGFLRAVLERRTGELDAARARLERLLARPRPAVVDARARSELARLLDRAGEGDEALRTAREGQARLLALPEAARLDRRAFPDLVRRVRAVLPELARSPAAAVPGGSPLGAAAPIFVVGFPRSGTTLVEHVLAALPGAVPSDEEPLVDRLVQALPAHLGRAFRYPEDLPSLTGEELGRLRAEYLAVTRARLGSGRRLVDKNPWNLVHAPFLRRLFPESPLVVVLRDPRDAVTSAFLQDFRPNVATVQLFDLERAARCCADLLGLWLAARGDLAGWREQRYEDLVADFETEARALVAFAGEPWDDGVAAFHERAARRAVSTPSRDAVGRPVTSGAVGRWRRYGEALAEIAPILAPVLEPFGYGSEGGAPAPPIPRRGEDGSPRPAAPSRR